jgi:protein translocase SecG subunit
LQENKLSAIIESDMEIIRTILPYVQIILSILLVAAILLQQRGSSLGGAFGGDNFSATYHKRRGAELFLFKLSVILGILFVGSAFLNLVL